MIRLSEYLDFFMQNLLRIDYENILLKTSANLWGDYREASFYIVEGDVHQRLDATPVNYKMSFKS